jgi:DNA-directed RNA polymerase subunit M/transcription elongation factor TFIIS
MHANTKTETMKISCSGCHAHLTVKKADEGKKIKCPKCREPIVCSATAPTELSPQKKPSAKSENHLMATVQPASAPVATMASADSDDWGAPTRKTNPAPKRTAPASAGDGDEKVSGLVKWGGGGVVAVLLIVGCYYLYGALLAGPSVGNLSGKVYFGDTLLNSGKVVFTPKSGKSVPCAIRPDGTYEAKGIERGELIITVIQLNPKYKDGATRKKEAMEKIENPVNDGETQYLLPEIYADTMKSPLRFDLQKSSDTYDIHLEMELE